MTQAEDEKLLLAEKEFTAQTRMPNKGITKDENKLGTPRLSDGGGSSICALNCQSYDQFRTDVGNNFGTISFSTWIIKSSKPSGSNMRESSLASGERFIQ